MLDYSVVDSTVPKSEYTRLREQEIFSTSVEYVIPVNSLRKEVIVEQKAVHLRSEKFNILRKINFLCGTCFCFSWCLFYTTADEESSEFLKFEIPF